MHVKQTEMTFWCFTVPSGLRLGLSLKNDVQVLGNCSAMGFPAA